MLRNVYRDDYHSLLSVYLAARILNSNPRPGLQFVHVKVWATFVVTKLMLNGNNMRDRKFFRLLLQKSQSQTQRNIESETLYFAEIQKLLVRKSGKSRNIFLATSCVCEKQNFYIQNYLRKKKNPFQSRKFNSVHGIFLVCLLRT